MFQKARSGTSLITWLMFHVSPYISGSLKRHFMSHHMGVKNHVCDLCGKAFFRKEYLTSHKAQHAGLTIEMAKRKRQELRAAEQVSTSMHYVKEDVEEAQQERDGEEVSDETLYANKLLFIVLTCLCYLVPRNPAFSAKT